MRVEWAIPVERIESREVEGRTEFDAFNVGLEGLDAIDADLPRQSAVWALMCFRLDEEDKAGEFHKVRLQVTGPDGPQKPRETEIASVAGREALSPEIRRYVLPTGVPFEITSGGEYIVRITDEHGGFYEFPLFIAALPRVR